MKVLPLNLCATVGSRSEVEGLLHKAGDATLIQRGVPRWMMLLCPCGCGEIIPINLDRRAGKAWRFYEGGAAGCTVFPSVWRDTGCQSHFVVWRGKIHLIDLLGSDRAAAVPEFEKLKSRVFQSWPTLGLHSYVDLADQLEEIPWDVLEACRSLARDRMLVEGNGDQRTHFKRP